MEVEAEVTGSRTGSRTGVRSEVVEVVTRGERRRTWSADQKRMAVVEALQPGAKPAEVMRRWGISSGLFYDWRRQMLAGELGPTPTLLPAFAQAAVAEDAPAALSAPESPARSPARIEVVLLWDGAAPR